MVIQIVAGVIFLVAVAVPALAAPPARNPIDNIQVNGWPSSMKPERDSPLLVTVSLKNTGTTSAGPFEVEVQPFAARHDINQPLSGIRLRPQESTARTITVLPNHTGPVELLVRLRSGTSGDLRFEKIGVVEIVEPLTLFQRYRDLLTLAGPFVSALIVAVMTLTLQLFLFQGGRRQKAHETVSQIVTAQSRDYYSAVLSAVSELARSLRHVSTSGTNTQRDHFVRRAFYFFGVFIYKESEFAFRGGLFYLPHLWAEDVVARLLTEISEQVKLPLMHEAIVHKCFSDVERIRNRYDKDDPTIRFAVRTFHDLDELLQRPVSATTPSEERDLVAAFSAAAPQFADPEVIERIRAIEAQLRAVITYEFTKMFGHWYRGRNARRTLPEKPPEDFEAISGEDAHWEAILDAASKEDRAGSSQR